MKRNKVERKYNPAEYDAEFEGIPINRRRCIVFLPDSPNDKLCHCNRTKDEHPNTNNHFELNEKWQQDCHTIKDSTKEQGVSLVNGAPYVRCDIETDPCIIEKILLNIWRLPQPALLIQITCGHKYFKLQGKLKIHFFDDFIKFVCQSNTWLITHGGNVGIVQRIGEAIHKRKLTEPQDKAIAIGVCNYGCVKNLNDFQRPEHIQLLVNSSSSSSSSEDQKLKILDQSQIGQQNLEMNHTHFILLDDGTIQYYNIDDGTIQYYNIDDYRTRLTKTIAHNLTKQTFPIPTVTLLFEGDEDSIRSIYNDLRENIPVIIINNTGRIVDYLVRWLIRTEEMDFDLTWINPIDINDEIDVRITLNETFKRRESLLINSKMNFQSIQIDESNHFNRNRLRFKFDKYFHLMYDELNEIIHEINQNNSSIKMNQEIILMILYCLQPTVRSNLNIFNYNKNENLTEIILYSICQSVQMKIQRKLSNQLISHNDYLLELAIDWNCLNTAKEWIVQDSMDNIYNKKEIFSRALIKQRHQFIDYFLQLNFPFDEIFFHSKLNRSVTRISNYNEFLKILYTEETINRENSILRNIIKTTNDQNQKVINSTNDLNNLFQILIGNYIKSLYYDTQIEEQENGTSVKHLTNIISPRQDLKQEQLIANDIVYKDYIIRDLFLWSIVMNYMNLTKVFLAHMKDRICGALIATEILSHLHDISVDVVDNNKKVNLIYWINYFEEYAIHCIDLCFKNDPNMAQILTIQRIEMFGDVTCLQIANNGKTKRFASHSCCRQTENNIWYDKLHSNQFHLRYYIGQFIGIWSLGLLAPFFTRFRTINQNSLLTEPTLQSYGINYCDSYVINHFNGRITKIFYQIYQFHQSLHIKFIYHYIQYMIFLFLFSYVLLFHFDPINSNKSSIHPAEIFLIIIVTCMFIEEIRIVIEKQKKEAFSYFVELTYLTKENSECNLSLLGKCHSYFRYFFKQLCIISFILFYIGLIIRFLAINDSRKFQIARIIMGYDLWICWIRSFSFIIVNPFLGFHLVSIGKMLKKLSFFAIFISIVMTAYGVASRSIAFYGKFEFNSRNVLQYVFYPVYYLLYANLSNELSELDEATPDSHSIATHILLAFHMLLINILLVNFLIAMFNKSFQDMQSVQIDIWNFQQYAVIREYYYRPPLFIPFSTIFDIIALMKIFYQWYLRVRYNCVNPLQRVFKMIAVQPELEHIWQEFESTSTYAYAQREALTKIDRVSMETEASLRESSGFGIRSTDAAELSSDINKKENDSITHLRNEFKAAIKDLRNDLRLLTKQK